MSERTVVDRQDDEPRARDLVQANVPTTRGRALHRATHLAARLIGWIADAWFRERRIEKALVLESLAAAPPLVVGTLRALRSQRRIEGDPRLVALVHEADHEREHMLLFAALCVPSFGDRVWMRAGQPPLVIGLSLLFALSEGASQRLCAYFEEEAIESYARHREAIARGAADPVVPAWACARWSLPEGATLSALLPAIEREEAEHRDLHHALADDPRG